MPGLNRRGFFALLGLAVIGHTQSLDCTNPTLPYFSVEALSYCWSGPENTVNSWTKVTSGPVWEAMWRALNAWRLELPNREIGTPSLWEGHCGDSAQLAYADPVNYEIIVARGACQPTGCDLYSVLLHEVGHLLGVPHIEGDRLMDSKYQGKSEKPSRASIARAQLALDSGTLEIDVMAHTAMKQAAERPVVVEVRAWSDNTWIAWHGVGFAVEGQQACGMTPLVWLPATCIAESKWGSGNCADLVSGKTQPGWNGGNSLGWVRFKVTGRPVMISLAPCCGNPVKGWSAVSFIEIKVDGVVVHRAFHRYSLDSGTLEIEIPERIR